jgi:hypothetical protein
MALVVEDGTGLATAESFISVAAALTYHSDRGNAAWALLTTAQQEQSLREAADYMEQVYRLRWAGYRTTGTQALSWPRTLVPQPDAPGGYRAWPFYYANNVVPQLVQFAAASLALRASAGALAPDVARATKTETVDVVSVTYMDGTREFAKYREVDNMLAVFMGTSNNSMNLGVMRS